jgi:hypothetical protein
MIMLLWSRPLNDSWKVPKRAMKWVPLEKGEEDDHEEVGMKQ